MVVDGVTLASAKRFLGTFDSAFKDSTISPRVLFWEEESILWPIPCIRGSNLDGGGRSKCLVTLSESWTWGILEQSTIFASLFCSFNPDCCDRYGAILLVLISFVWYAFEATQPPLIIRASGALYGTGAFVEVLLDGVRLFACACLDPGVTLEKSHAA